ncbi:hypothetical protein VFPBJ_05135 [Purpureocillium lilacinum]|uniref:Uncharacterized protein n=1 Tax=Purpureocillium lilacinum TaxID=33203 RepID=A0A179GQB6_PURLI|nr:hypothetical protein VFPBJ_05135 [Purpureocillium lilacinum]
MEDGQRGLRKTLGSLFGRSRTARTAAAQTTSSAGVSVRESGNSGLKTSTSVGDSLHTTDLESSQRLTAPFVASIIGGNGLTTISEGIRIVNKIKTGLDEADQGKARHSNALPTTYRDGKFLQSVSVDGLRLASEYFANAAWPSNLPWIRSWPSSEVDSQSMSGFQEPLPSHMEHTKAQDDFPEILKIAADACDRVRRSASHVVHLEESDAATSISGAPIRLPRDRLGLFKPTDVSFTISDVPGAYAGGTVVLAIRGSSTWMDWMVNFNYGMGISGLKAHADEQDMMVSIINEGDPVPRADIAYVETLLHLYAKANRDNGFVQQRSHLCRLPPMSLHVGASILGLRLVAADTEVDGTYLPPQVRAVGVPQTILEKSLAGNSRAHSMTVYAANVAAFLGQDRPSFKAKVFTTKNITSVGTGALSPEGEDAGLQFGGFKEWFLSNDLDRQDGWQVYGVVDHCWSLVA